MTHPAFGTPPEEGNRTRSPPWRGPRPVPPKRLREGGSGRWGQRWQKKTFANSSIDLLYLTDIYPASEDPIAGVTSEKLAKSIMEKNPAIKVVYYPTYEEIEKDVKKILSKGDLLLTIGAGKVNKIAEHLAEK